MKKKSQTETNAGKLTISSNDKQTNLLKCSPVPWNWVFTVGAFWKYKNGNKVGFDIPLKASEVERWLGMYMSETEYGSGEGAEKVMILRWSNFLWHGRGYGWMNGLVTKEVETHYGLNVD